METSSSMSLNSGKSIY